MIAMIKSMTIEEMVMKVQTAVKKYRTECELRDYYKSLDWSEQEMDWVIDMCYERLIEIRNRNIKRSDLLRRDW